MDLDRIRTGMIAVGLAAIFTAIFMMVGVLGPTGAGVDPAQDVLVQQQIELKTQVKMQNQLVWSLRFLLGGAAICLLWILWHARSLNANWLQVIAFAFKALGLMLVLLMLFWGLSQFQANSARETREKAAKEDKVLKELQAERERERKDAETKRQAELAVQLKKEEEAAAEASYRANSENATRFILALSQLTQTPQRIALARAYTSRVFDDEQRTLPLVEALFALALIDTDQEFKNAIMDGLKLPPELLAQKRRFADAVLAHLETGGNASKAKESPWVMYVNLIKSRDDDPAMSKRIQDLDAKYLTPALVTSAADGLANDSDPNAQKTYAQELLLATSSENPVIQKQAIDKLDAALKSATTASSDTEVNPTSLLIKQAIDTLPKEVKIPSRLYLQTSSKNDSAVLLGFRDRLKGTNQVLVLGPRVVGDDVPSITEVRYYSPSSEETARGLRSILVSSGLDESEVKLSLQRPTKSDLRVSRDISSHYEIWFAKGAPQKLK